jgi:hypothetical protein
VLGLHALRGTEAPGASRIAKHGAWGSLHVWQQAPDTEQLVEGAHEAAKPASLNHVVPTRQQRSWCLLMPGYGLPGATEAAAVMGEESLSAAGVLGPACQAWASRSQVQ